VLEQIQRDDRRRRGIDLEHVALADLDLVRDPCLPSILARLAHEHGVDLDPDTAGAEFASSRDDDPEKMVDSGQTTWRLALKR